MSGSDPKPGGRTPTTARARRWWRRGLFAAVVAAAAFAVIWQQSRGPIVEPVRPTVGPVVETLAIIGRVAPSSEVRFLARASSAVTQTPVREGDHVQAGQLLLHMDDEEALAAVMQAEAALAQARAQTKQVRTVGSKTATANLREAQAQRDEAQRAADSDESLFAGGTITATELDRSRTALTVTRSRARAAELQAAATSKKGSQWQAAVAAETFAEAGLLVAKSRAAQFRIVAPAAGTVTARDVEVGDVVQPAAPLVTLVMDGPKELVIEPDEKNLASLRLGQAARASTEAFPGESFDATVRYLAPSVDPMRGTIEVRLSVAEPPAYLRTDMTVSVDIVVGRSEDAMSLPSSVVRDLASADPWVWVVDKRRLRRQRVQIGFRGEAVVEVLDGVAASDVVVSVTDVSLEAGDKIRFSEP